MVQKRRDADRETLSVEEVAKIFEVNRRTILNWLNWGWLKGHKAGLGLTSRWQVSVASVKELQRRAESEARKQ